MLAVTKKNIVSMLSHSGASPDTSQSLADKIVKALPDSMTEKSLCDYVAATAQSEEHGMLAGNIVMTYLHVRSKPFTETMLKLPLSPAFQEKIKRLQLDEHLMLQNDFTYDLFALRTLQKGYLLSANGVTERPQHMLMRVAASLHDDKESILRCYRALSNKQYTHATPTLYNSGCQKGQLASCFLGVMQDDSILGIFNTIRQCALISKGAGGIGLSISNIRAKGSVIQSAMGESSGIVPMLRVFNETARYVDQGRRRKGAFAVFLEPWHRDIQSFLDLRRNTGDENAKARDLFTALWVPDLFMERVEKDQDWTLFCPTEINLQDVHSEEFNASYIEAEKTGGVKIRARKLWEQILRTQIETGTPYIMFKDQINRTSNQSNLGTIKGSNLCAEIALFTSPEEIAVCTLASVALPRFVTHVFQFEQFGKAVEEVVKNLDRVIDTTFYPQPEARRSNLRHRPLGIGVQGLSDVFQKLNVPYDSEEALDLDAEIFETMYFHALKASVELAKQHGPYESFAGSPASRGILQFDHYGITPTRYDWAKMKQDIMTHGLRNSQLLALMPTASSAQLLGNSEGTDPRTSNMYTRRVLSGEFVVTNRYLKQKVDNWQQVKRVMEKHSGSVQNAPVSDETKKVFKTVWEISQKWVIDHAARRQPFVCQSQSMNLFLAEPTVNKVSAMLFYAWKKKLKTGMYYLRSQPKLQAVQCDACSA